MLNMYLFYSIILLEKKKKHIKLFFFDFPPGARLKVQWMYLMYVPIFPFQLFYSFFKSLVGKDVVVELKNEVK